MHQHAALVGAGAYALLLVVHACDQTAGYKRRAFDAQRVTAAFERVVAGAAVGAQFQALAAVNETQQAFAAVAQAPAVGDAPGRMRVGAGGGVGVGGVFVVQQAGGGGQGQQGRGQGVFLGQDVVEVAVEVGGVDGAVDHLRVAHQLFQEGDVGLGADHFAVGQGFAQAGEGTRAVGVVHDELGDHRVVVDRDRVAFDHAGVQAHVCAGGGQAQHLELARAGQETLRRIFGVQAHFDGMAGAGDVVLVPWQGFAGGYAQLPFDQVQAGHQLGDRVFYLQAGIDFHEVEITLRADDEFDGAGVDVIDGAGGFDRGLAHALAQFGRDEGRGRFFHDLLVAALG